MYIRKPVKKLKIVKKNFCQMMPFSGEAILSVPFRTREISTRNRDRLGPQHFVGRKLFDLRNGAESLQPLQVRLHLQKQNDRCKENLQVFEQKR